MVTGRCADAALALAPMVHEFGWNQDQWDLLAAGIAAGDVIECGTQATGGNCQFDWKTTPDFAHIGYPLIEAHADGRMVITKHPGTGGRVTQATVKEQLVYEIGDPARYMTPDVVADFTSIRLEDDGPDRVALHGVHGTRRPEMLEGVDFLSTRMEGGRKAGLLRARRALESADGDRIVRQRWPDLGLRFRKDSYRVFRHQCLPRAPGPHIAQPAEAEVHIGARDPEKQKLERFTRELIPLALNGPPTATGYGEGRPQVREVVAYWPALDSARSYSGRGGVSAMKIRLFQIAHARSGDKGDISNIGLIAVRPGHYELLEGKSQPAASRITLARWFWGLSRVTNYRTWRALNFVMEQALDGGGTISLRTDAQGKTHGAALLTMEIEVEPDELAD